GRATSIGTNTSDATARRERNQSTPHLHGRESRRREISGAGLRRNGRNMRMRGSYWNGTHPREVRRPGPSSARPRRRSRSAGGGSDYGAAAPAEGATMPKVMIICQETGKDVPTGIELPEGSDLTGHAARVFQCAACGKQHAVRRPFFENTRPTAFDKYWV